MDLISIQNHNGDGKCEYCVQVGPRDGMYVDLDQGGALKLICPQCAAELLVEQYGALPRNFATLDAMTDFDVRR
jgi:hypothetical protein